MVGNRSGVSVEVPVLNLGDNLGQGFLRLLGSALNVVMLKPKELCYLNAKLDQPPAKNRVILGCNVQGRYHLSVEILKGLRCIIGMDLVVSFIFIKGGQLRDARFQRYRKEFARVS